MARRTFGSVRRLRSGRWQVRYTKDGRQVSLPGTHPTKADAGRALARLQSDMDRGSYVDPKAGGIIFAKYSEGWLASRLVKGQPLAPRTRELYRWQLAKYLQPTFGAIELRRLTADAVRAWHATLSGPAGPGALTAAKCYRLLRAILNTALEDGLIAANPCTIRGAGREQISDRTMLTPEQIGRVAEELGPRYRAVILLAAWAGLRFGELAGLRRSRLDLDAGVVTVAEAVSYLPEGVRHVGPPKSEAGRRTVAIPPHIIPALREHLDLFAEPGSDGLVFVGPKGGPLRNANFGRSVWRPARARAGIPSSFTLHDLRGVSATLAARSGATTKELMLRLGHSTPDVAMRYQRAEAARDSAIAQEMSKGAGKAHERSGVDKSGS